MVRNPWQMFKVHANLIRQMGRPSLLTPEELDEIVAIIIRPTTNAGRYLVPRFEIQLTGNPGNLSVLTRFISY
jgi:hypothetical protein